MVDTMSGLFSMFSSWEILGVPVTGWFIGFLLIGVVAIFVKGNR